VDDIYVGYRHYDKNNIAPKFEFGYGLSYSTFEYSNLAVKDLGDKVEVKYTIKNTSNVDGKEISQIYYSAPCKEIDRPVKELCEYSKDLIKAGEEKEITVLVDKERLTYFDVKKDDFVMEKGEHTIMVGASSRNIKLQAKIVL
jgi:beta-glucosidase